jgi:translocation and assembly module TamB
MARRLGPLHLAPDGRNITITYISNVGSTQEQVIQVEYNVNRNVSIVALRDYNGTFGIDVKIKKRFP